MIAIKNNRFLSFQTMKILFMLITFLIGYIPPNRHIVARHLKRLRQHHGRKIIDDLKSIDNISITVDFWTNRRMRSFSVITGHYETINSYNVQSTVLDFSTFNHRILPVC